MATVQLKNVCKRFGTAEIIKNLSLELADKEFVVFVGPSGCGKTTLLRMIAGLEEIDGGVLLIDGVRMNETGPADRGLAMVFQSYALYPHMTVRQNMTFSLRLARVPQEERDRKIAAAARILHLEEYLDHKPGQLSGGQRQRVAIGRAIVRNPKVFLLDEPLSNLDAALRGQMRGELGRLHQDLAATMIYVTHDQVEAMTMADRIVVLRAGRVEQVGTPQEIYRRPANTFVAGFIGTPPMNMLPARIITRESAGVRLALPGQSTVSLPLASNASNIGDAVTLGVRPEGLKPQSTGVLSGTTHLVERLGAITLIHVDLDSGGRAIAQVGANEEVRTRERISLAIDADHCNLFDHDGNALP